MTRRRGGRKGKQEMRPALMGRLLSRVHFSTDVEFAREKEPVFPGCCVGCGVSGASSHYVVSTRGSSDPVFLFGRLKRLVAMWKRRRWFAVEIPACPSCAVRLRRVHDLRKLAYFAPLILAIATFVWLHWTCRSSEALPFLAYLVWAVVWVVYEVARPEAVFVTETRDCITYEFRSRQYAEDFARLNETAIKE